MSDFSANLKRLRKRAERSQDSLAEELQVSRQTVSGWERGRSYPDLDMLLRLCDALHATPDQLFHPQLGVKTLLDGGRRRTKNLYGVVKRTVPAGQVRQ